MGSALKLAMAKAADLPEAAQEQLGRELLLRLESLTQLRAEIDVGVRTRRAGAVVCHFPFAFVEPLASVTPNLIAALRTAFGCRPVRLTISSSDFDDAAISTKRRSSLYDHRLITAPSCL